MIITVQRTSRGLNLNSHHPKFRQYVNVNRNKIARYHVYNYTGNDIYCYDNELFSLMEILTEYFNKVEDEAVMFDVES